MDKCSIVYSSNSETGSSISIYRCREPTPIPSLCHGNYLYEDDIYLYTIACPLSKTTTTTTTTTSTPVQTTTQLSTTTSLTRAENISTSLNLTQNVSVRNASIVDFKVMVKSQDPSPKKNSFDYLPIIIISSITVFCLSSLVCAVFILKKKKKKMKRQNSSSVMPRIIYEQQNRLPPPLPPRPRKKKMMTEDQRIEKEVKRTLMKCVNTVCKWEGAPPAPSRPPRPKARGRMRKKTLDYLHDQNPILSALNKPARTFHLAGQERALRLQEEVLAKARQEKRSRGGQRLRNILRIKQLGKK